VISPFTEVELASAFAKKVREKEISADSSDKILNEFKLHVQQSFYKKNHDR
jgi:hypothetical protein